MGKLIVTAFLTLDGVVRGPGHVDAQMGAALARWQRRASAFLQVKNIADYCPSTGDLPRHVVTGDLAAEIRRLKARYDGELQLHASGSLVAELDDLVDEYRLLVFPVVLGEGHPLFPAGAHPLALRPLSTSATSTGVVIQEYAAAGAPTFGSMA
ncbi:dihydrofolate reductase family protein [Amycolatopsis sp. NPDC051372]|uniref:dihydrofolate reductase family protein n=1 Tax=Amycolatopsis sp. NPDC051372 TaxID=3155669 RepID=UPI00341F2965